MPPPRKISFLIGLCLLSPRVSFAWGRVGHQTVALIAEDRINPSTEEKIHALLGTNVGLDDIAVCADDIKRRSVNCGGAFFVKYSPRTRGWHFIDIPIADNPNTQTLDRYCARENCVVDQIADDLHTLKDPAADRSEKQLALMFLVHFIGDLHQPLHCATDTLGNKKGDQGGNAKKLFFLAAPNTRRPMNLHHLWDNIIEKDSAEKKLNARTLARRLEKDISRKDEQEWSKGTARKWAVESFGIAQKTIYPSYYLDEDKRFGLDYQESMKPIAEEQLEKAGVRLADLLDGALAGVSVADLERKPARKTINAPAGGVRTNPAPVIPVTH